MAGAGMKLGIIKLGKVAGKTKYALLDECDIGLSEQYAFEAKVQVDPDGSGVAVYAWAVKMDDESVCALYLHDLVWQHHHGDVPTGCKVVHVNHLTMDNRADNLALAPKSSRPRPPATTALKSKSSQPHHTSSSLQHHHQHRRTPTAQKHVTPTSTVSPAEDKTEVENSLYYLAIQQLPVDPLEELSNQQETIVRKAYDVNGEVIHDEDDLHLPSNPNSYYECRYAPCCKLEQELRAFSICGRCQVARYCGLSCQQRDWPQHKRYCRERKFARSSLHPPPYYIPRHLGLRHTNTTQQPPANTNDDCFVPER